MLDLLVLYYVTFISVLCYPITDNMTCCVGIIKRLFRSLVKVYDREVFKVL